MWASNADHAILKIEQNGAVLAKADGKHFWELHWVLNTGSKDPLQERNVTLKEPFTPKMYDKVAKYLDEALDDPNFDQTQADKDSKRINDYRRNLFSGLKLISVIEAVRGKYLEIHIWPDKEHESGRRSIHSIQWEQLEDLSLWAKGAEPEGAEPEQPLNGVLSVTVCRHVHVEKSIKIGSEEALRAARQGRNGTFDVLLVIARPHVHDSPELPRKVLNPATIRSVLLQLQEELRSTGSSQRIRLEIVRPGRLVELRDHLENRRRMYEGQRPYHVIHFDMHGGV
jgi:heme-degrading monooxygenase HmoA